MGHFKSTVSKIRSNIHTPTTIIEHQSRQKQRQKEGTTICTYKHSLTNNDQVISRCHIVKQSKVRHKE